MNFKNIPELSFDWGYPLVLVRELQLPQARHLNLDLNLQIFMACIAAGMLVYFKSQGELFLLHNAC